MTRRTTREHAVRQPVPQNSKSSQDHDLVRFTGQILQIIHQFRVYHHSSDNRIVRSLFLGALLLLNCVCARALESIAVFLP